MSEEKNDREEQRQAAYESLTSSELLVAIMNRISNDIDDEALGRVLLLLDEIAEERKRSA